MLICAAGDVHGALNRLYEDVLVFEAVIGIRFDCVLQVGDFRIWPDTSRIDRAARHHDGAGDFPTWLGEWRAVPRRTLFIKGNHEDFVWLDGQGGADVLPGLTYPRKSARRGVCQQDTRARPPAGPAPSAGLFLWPSPRASRRRRRWGPLHRTQSSRHARKPRRDRTGAGSA